MEKICLPSKPKFQKHQVFVKNAFTSKTKRKSMLLYHGIGSGKTLTSIYAAKQMLENNIVDRVFIVTPAALVQNFRDEFANRLLNYKSIPKEYIITSYMKFIKMTIPEKSLVIIDEVQNIVSEKGSLYKQFYKKLVVRKPQNLRLIILSATPIVDKPIEIALTMNLLDIRHKFNVELFYNHYINDETDSLQNTTDFKSRIKGYVSFFPGATKTAYAARRDRVVMCKMSKHQQQGYNKSVLGIATDFNYSQKFLIGPRMASNIVYPNGGFTMTSRPSDKELRTLFKNDLATFSTKFFSCVQTLLKSKRSAFVYTNFVKSAGVDDFVEALNSHPQLKNTFGVFRSGEDENNKKVLNAFNSGTIRIIIGSPAMKEGITLLNCREVHILDPYWNTNRTEQIIGRAIRFCSHVSLPPKQRVVDVYHYVATTDDVKTVDKHIMHLAHVKDRTVSKFAELIKEASTDCKLWHKRNCLTSFKLSNNMNIGHIKKKKGAGLATKKKKGIIVFKAVPKVTYAKKSPIPSSVKLNGLNKKPPIKP